MKHLDEAIIEALPANIEYISRDEKGDLWATHSKPEIVKGFLEFSVEDINNNNDTQSLSVFNHRFKAIERLGILEINIGLSG